MKKAKFEGLAMTLEKPRGQRILVATESQPQRSDLGFPTPNVVLNLSHFLQYKEVFSSKSGTWVI